MTAELEFTKVLSLVNLHSHGEDPSVVSAHGSVFSLARLCPYLLCILLQSKINTSEITDILESSLLLLFFKFQDESNSK